MENASNELIPVPSALLYGVINYLAARPYAEVSEGIDGLKAAIRAHQARARENVARFPVDGRTKEDGSTDPQEPSDS